MERREEVFETGRDGGCATALAWVIDRETAVVAPGDVFRHPREVLAHPALSRRDKRAILAAWASDAHAVVSAPALRRLPGSVAESVPVDAVLAALAELDAAEAREDRPAGPGAQRPRLSILAPAFRNRRRDDDDDPPPCPATAMPAPRPPIPSVDAVAAAA